MTSAQLAASRSSRRTQARDPKGRFVRVKDEPARNGAAADLAPDDGAIRGAPTTSTDEPQIRGQRDSATTAALQAAYEAGRFERDAASNAVAAEIDALMEKQRRRRQRKKKAQRQKKDKGPSLARVLTLTLFASLALSFSLFASLPLSLSRALILSHMLSCLSHSLAH